MRITTLFAFCLLLCGCAHGVSTTRNGEEGSNYREDLKSGEELFGLLQSSVSQEILNRFVGRRAAFAGSSGTFGGEADLLIAKGVGLRVIITPQREVRPQAVAWNAEVDGVIQNVDGQTKIITIRVRPEDYAIGDTM